MKTSTLLLLGGAVAGVIYLKKQADAKAATAAASAPVVQSTAIQPIMDTSTTVTSIDRTVNDPGTNTDDPNLNDQNYGVVSSWRGYDTPTWGSYGSQRGR